MYHYPHHGAMFDVTHSLMSIIAYYITSYSRKFLTKQRNTPGERL